VWRLPHVLAIAVACAFGTTPIVSCAEKPKTVIVLDHWWNIDYAKNTCGGLLPRGFDDPGLATCQNQQAAALNDFEFRMSTQFAARSECAGITVIGFDFPAISRAAQEAISGEHWALSVNYSTQDSKTQQWQMILSPVNRNIQQGEGAPEDIASDVCSIAAGRGARLVN
jgi:hypothetical protein